ncbi:MAG TPA: DinB family protein [Thermoanaerobaculia bacterium]|jgi:uncharacterized damage-inducible protein DinB
MKRTRWFDRAFDLGLPSDAFPAVVERLRGTPARLEDRIWSLPPDILTQRPQDTWSIQENAGHLLDLEPLWLGRLDDALSGAEVLRPADLTNRGTDEANHNARPIDEVLAAFRRERSRLVSRLDALDDAQILASALHPRLRQPMSVVDLFFFVAEHDDHHLVRITEIVGEQESSFGNLDRLARE